MTATTFRRSWVRTIPLGLLDIGLHAYAALVLLPGPWWLQYLPDLFVPVLWLRSMLTNRMASEDSHLLWWHRTLHVHARVFHTSVLVWWLLALLAAWRLGISLWVLPLHVLVHVLIDRVTHGEGWQ